VPSVRELLPGLVGALLLPHLSACTEEPAQVLVYVSADDTMQAAATALRVRVCSASEAPSCTGGYDEQRALADAPLPARIPIGPPSRLDQRFWVEASLLDDDGAIATLRAEGGFVAQERRAIRLHFSADCRGQVCGPRQTCFEGACTDACYETEPDQGGGGRASVPGPCGGGPVDGGPADMGPVDSGPVDGGPTCECPCASDGCVDGVCVPSVSVERLGLGERHSCVAAPSGIFCFGENSYGQLGLGEERVGVSTDVPERVGLEGRVIDLDAGARTTCVVLADGTLHCWGDDADARLGPLERGDRAAPERVGAELGDDTEFARIALDHRHGCAVTTTSAAYCWGRADEGQLGSQEEPLPTLVVGPTRIMGTSFDAVTVGDDFSCGLTGSVGSPRCWGANGVGEVGQAAGMDYVIAPEALAFRRYVQVDADHRRACALAADTGRVYCWGLNAGNRSGLGDTSMGNEVREPTAVAGDVAFARIAVGQEHTCAIDRDGALWCWGFNGDGQLALGDTTRRTSPTQVGTDTDWVTVGAGAFHTCATKSDGRLYCWGRGLSAQLGASCGRDDVTTPCRVCFP